MNAVLIRILDVANRIIAVLILLGVIGALAAAGYRFLTGQLGAHELLAFLSYPGLALIAGFLVCGVLAVLIDMRDQLLGIKRSTSYYRAPSPRDPSGY